MIAHKKMSESRIHHNYKEFLHIKMDPQSIIHENMYNFHFFTNQTGNEIIDMYEYTSFTADHTKEKTMKNRLVHHTIRPSVDRWPINTTHIYPQLGRRFM